MQYRIPVKIPVKIPMKITVVALSLLAPLCMTPQSGLADGMPTQANQARQPQVPAEKIDPRLPPVVPGQRVHAGGST